MNWTAIPLHLILAASFGPLKKRIPRKIFSEMVTGGKLTWSKVRSDGNSGEVLVNPSNVDWQRNTQTLSSVEASEWQGWAVVKFKMRKSVSYDFSCLGVNTFL